MATLLYNLARMYTATPGTGTVTLTGAVLPFLTFDQAGVQNGDTVYYAINDFVGGNVEIGVGTYTTATKRLSRDTVYRSSGLANTGKISLSGSAEVFISPPKEIFSGFLPVVGTMRTPPAAATVPILTTDIEVGLDTTATAVSATLPTATAWAAANQNGLELVLFDYTGQGDTHNITPVLSGSDIFKGGFTPLVTSPFGLIKIRPIPGVGWYIR